MTKRNFTMTEEADICCSRHAGGDFMEMDDDTVTTAFGDTLEAHGDNLYRVTRKDGKVEDYDSLQVALDSLAD